MTTTPHWSERVPADEPARLERLAAQLRTIQRTRAAGGQALRGLHAKANAVARARFSTVADLPAWAAVGIFAAPTSLPALVRFSNGSGGQAHDRGPDVRGVAVKILDVPGKKLIPGMEDARTQDLLAILTPAIPFATPEAFVGVVRAASGPKALALPRMIGALGLFRFLPVLKQLQAGMKRPTPPLAEATYYSALPIRWGEAAVKFALVPLPSLAPNALATRDDPDHLGNELAARLMSGPLRWDLRIQPFVSEATTPIEDPTVVWDPAISPWLTVGRLELPQQDLRSPEAVERARRVDRLSFDPWHAPVAFRPLGAMMRARAVAYRESVLERGTDPEPEGHEAWLTNG